MNRKQRRAKNRDRRGDDHNLERKMAHAHFAADAAWKISHDQAAQRMLWLVPIALNAAFGIGPERMKLFFDELNKVEEEYVKMVEEGDEEYANEKLRQAAERVSGMKVNYLYENERVVAEMEVMEHDDQHGGAGDDGGRPGAGAV